MFVLFQSDQKRVDLIVDVFLIFFFFFQAEDGIRDLTVTGVQTCALPIYQPAVKVNGAVTSPGSVLWQQGKGLGYYIEGAGGYGNRADKGRVSVTYANGEVRTRKKALLFRSDPQPGPGAEVFVPVRDTLARVNYVQLFTSLAQIIASAVTTFYVIKHL